MKTQPTEVSVESFLETVSEARRIESNQLIEMMVSLTKKDPVMWGPSIIGFGSRHYKYETGTEGDIPKLSFSPRKAKITIYFNEGFDNYGKELAKLGKHEQSVSCLYIARLADIDLTVLQKMLELSVSEDARPAEKPSTVEQYISHLPPASRVKFDELRQIVRKTLPEAKEVLSYAIVGYKIDDKRARLYISGWKDHLGMYPVPSGVGLLNELQPFIKGKGTMWFPLDKPLPKQLIVRVVKDLAT